MSEIARAPYKDMTAPHAESNALNEVFQLAKLSDELRESIRGKEATLVVTGEPCPSSCITNYDDKPKPHEFTGQIMAGMKALKLKTLTITFPDGVHFPDGVINMENPNWRD